MRRGFPTIILLFFWASSGLFSGEQQKPKPQSPADHYEIVVTATRLETPAREVGSSLSIVSGFDLSRFKKTFVLEALREAPGVSVVQNGGMGEASSVSSAGPIPSIRSCSWTASSSTTRSTPPAPPTWRISSGQREPS